MTTLNDSAPVGKEAGPETDPIQKMSKTALLAHALGMDDGEPFIDGLLRAARERSTLIHAALDSDQACERTDEMRDEMYRVEQLIAVAEELRRRERTGVQS